MVVVIRDNKKLKAKIFRWFDSKCFLLPFESWTILRIGRTAN